MSKGVLGNDPFKRGAASSDPGSAEKPAAAAPKPVLTPQPKAAAKAKPVPPPPPPAKIVVPKAKMTSQTPARRALATLSSEPKEVKAPEKEVKAPEREVKAPEKEVKAPEKEVKEPKPFTVSGAEGGVESVSPSSKPERPVSKASASSEIEQPEPAIASTLIDPEEPASFRSAEDALASARDLTQGLAGPLLTAASGMFHAARSALGFGARGPVDTWGKDETLTRSLHPVGDFLYDRYFRVSVEGAEGLPTGPSIFVANHSGALPLDGPMLQYALQRERSDLAQARWLVEDQIFHAPVLGVLMNRLGAVRAHPENATRLLTEGRPVIVFPEGFLGISKPFTQRYQLKRFGRGGYVKLAIKCKVPIIPVAIVGAEESMPLLAKLPGGLFGLPYLPLTPPPMPSKWRIRFSEPVDVSGGTDDDLAWVQQQNDLVRDTIAGMIESLLRA